MVGMCREVGRKTGEGGGEAKSLPVLACEQVRWAGGGNIGVYQRIRRDLIGEQLLVITGYFWQFDVSSRL